ncbi:hypothetical protein B0H14DRAFT_2566555 [Mycena olivaceomarginata]|nr:hypothetical protein B0H14DRAFT_2566555 [Mycena olivaceomarginata]
MASLRGPKSGQTQQTVSLRGPKSGQTQQKVSLCGPMSGQTQQTVCLRGPKSGHCQLIKWSSSIFQISKDSHFQMPSLPEASLSIIASDLPVNSTPWLAEVSR